MSKWKVESGSSECATLALSFAWLEQHVSMVHTGTYIEWERDGRTWGRGPAEGEEEHGGEAEGPGGGCQAQNGGDQVAQPYSICKWVLKKGKFIHPLSSWCPRMFYFWNYLQRREPTGERAGSLEHQLCSSWGCGKWEASPQHAVMFLVIVVHTCRSIVWTFLIYFLAKVTGNRKKYDKAEEIGEGRVKKE